MLFLLVEDDPDDSYLISQAIADASDDVVLEVVADGEDAETYLRGDLPYDDRRLFPLPDLVLLDLNLPRRNGLEVLRWMKEDPVVDAIPVFIFSASTERRDVQEAYRLGANAYLTKDPHMKTLDAVANSLITYVATVREGVPVRAQTRYR